MYTVWLCGIHYYSFYFVRLSNERSVCEVIICDFVISVVQFTDNVSVILHCDLRLSYSLLTPSFYPYLTPSSCLKENDFVLSSPHPSLIREENSFLNHHKFYSPDVPVLSCPRSTGTFRKVTTEIEFGLKPTRHQSLYCR